VHERTDIEDDRVAIEIAQHIRSFVEDEPRALVVVAALEFVLDNHIKILSDNKKMEVAYERCDTNTCDTLARVGVEKND